MNPDLIIVGRAHSDAEVNHLKEYGADYIVLGEQEIADEMVRCLERSEQSERGSHRASL
jgi:CPA2 family monovalent cation:H+ antiporter-2